MLTTTGVSVICFASCISTCVSWKLHFFLGEFDVLEDCSESSFVVPVDLALTTVVCYPLYGLFV